MCGPWRARLASAADKALGAHVERLRPRRRAPLPAAAAAGVAAPRSAPGLGLRHFCKRHRDEVDIQGRRGAAGGGRDARRARLQGMWHALPDDEKLRWGAEAPMVRGDSVERKPRGISIDGRDVSSVDALDAVEPGARRAHVAAGVEQFLFEVEITSMRALTLDLAWRRRRSHKTCRSTSHKANCREWYVDGAGRAVHEEPRQGRAILRTFGLVRGVAARRGRATPAGPASGFRRTVWTWGSPRRTCRAPSSTCASRRGVHRRETP